jgi:hypothetical protein
MQIKFKVYGALCAMKTFNINGVDADKDDFGSQQDESPETAEDYACGDMRFTRKPSTPAVLSKYGITEEEYAGVCEKLEDELSFGCCDWCV